MPGVERSQYMLDLILKIDSDKPPLENELVYHIVECSEDQFGSRYIQLCLDKKDEKFIQLVFEETLPKVNTLITDVFGNYVI